MTEMPNKVSKKDAVFNIERSKKSNIAAFTLIEMLVVISIIGILLYLSLPALKNMSKSDAMGIANRQLMDDIARARRLAITHRTTVYMVFVPSNITSLVSLPPELQDRYERLAMSGYGMFAFRSAGEQPGKIRPRYFREWRDLPEGIFIAPWKFTTGLHNIQHPYIKVISNFLYRPFPFPDTNYPVINLPYFAFNHLGQLAHFQPNGDQYENEYNEIIPLTRGSMLISTNSSGVRSMDFQETPPGNSTNNFNWIVVDWLTGRCRIERPEIE